VKRFRDSTITSSKPYTFGTLIRALRLGYRWSDKHGCFVRLGNAGDRVHVQLCPGHNIPAKNTTKEYWVWWDDESILETIPSLSPVRGVKRPIGFYINKESGELL